MATSAFDSFDDGDTAKPPIMRHPAFPAVVAAWFATLLGLGTMVLPGVLLERLVDATGLAALLPAAAPPLGATARVLIALAAALAGGAAGWGLARRVAGSGDAPVEPQPASYPTGRRRPISVREELGDDGMFDDPGQPDDGWGPLGFEEGGMPDCDSAAGSPDDPGDDGMDLPQPGPAWAHDGNEPANADTAAERLPHDGTGEPLAFAAPSLAHRATGMPSGELPCGESADPVPLDGLGLVDLAERLRSSIERRREWAASTAETRIASDPMPIGLEAAPAEEAAQAMAAYFGRPTAIGADAVPSTRSARSVVGRDEPGFDAMASSRDETGQRPAPGPAETDAALRSALANLQRTSGGV